MFIFIATCPGNVDSCLLLEGRQMKLVSEWEVNPISESIALTEMISVIFIYSGSFRLFQLRNESVAGRRKALHELLCPCWIPVISHSRDTFSMDKVAWSIFTGLRNVLHLAAEKWAPGVLC